MKNHTQAPTPAAATGGHAGQPMRPPHHDMPALKQRLRIPEVWQTLKLEGQAAASCRSPFRKDKSPSFSVYQDGLRWKDHATGEGGDVIDFIAMARQTDAGAALRVFLDLAGVPRQTPRHAPQAPPHPDGIRVPLQHGRAEDRRLVAETRRLSPEAVSLGLALRTLTFAIVQGYRCWVLTDAARRIAEARRVDGMPFPKCGPLGRRKAHTLRGSRKSWPPGVAVLRLLPKFRTLLLVEGGPDYLAALHFATELERWDVLPVAMLGRSTGARIDAEALELMRGRRVRIFPHNDADGGGVTSARLWANQLLSVDCEVDFFHFSELHRTDGTPLKDLNDCTTGLDEASTITLCRTLFPTPDLEAHPPF